MDDRAISESTHGLCMIHGNLSQVLIKSSVAASSLLFSLISSLKRKTIHLLDYIKRMALK